MKIFKIEYKFEEILFFFMLTLVFGYMALDSFNFNPSARFFPLFLSFPGLILVILFVIRGLFPENVQKIMTGSIEIFKTSKKTIDKEDEKDNNEIKNKSILKSYFVFLFISLFILSSYCFGFYISTFIFLLLHLLINRKFKSNTIVGNLFILIFLLAMVYVFDTAFGYKFGSGAILSFP